jgi:pimeloyl-ACP methyl ester carboxylesterase
MQAVKIKKRNIKYYLYAILAVFILLIYIVTYADISVDDLKKEYASEHSKFIEVDGVQVHYRAEGSGFSIVLFYRTASSLHTWDAWTKELTKKYSVIRIDLPAFGITGPNKNVDYSIKAYTAFLDQFLAKINLDKFHLVGNSLGGNIAWNYTADHPQKIEKLILVDASGLPTKKPQPAIFRMAKTPVLSSLFLYITPKFFIKKI